MIRRTILRMAAASTLLVVGCTNKDRAPAEPVRGAPVTEDGVTATAVGGGIELRNARAEPIAYLVSDGGWLGLLASCAEAEVNCPRLGAGETATVPFAQIYGGADGRFTEARVVFWPVLNNRVGQTARELIVRR